MENNVCGKGCLWIKFTKTISCIWPWRFSIDHISVGYRNGHSIGEMDFKCTADSIQNWLKAFEGMLQLTRHGLNNSEIKLCCRLCNGNPMIIWIVAIRWQHEPLPAQNAMWQDVWQGDGSFYQSHKWMTLPDFSY